MAKYPARMHIYQAADGWRWRLKARNSRIVNDSGQAYRSEQHARRAAEALAAAKIEVAQ